MTDLLKLLNNMRKFSLEFELGYIKSIMLDLLNGINFLHKNFVVHRDLKLSNILIGSDGYYKITDFGLARHFSYPSNSLTPKLVTLWYRAPEILLNIGKYSWQCDIWSLGCIFCELLLGGETLLKGNNEVQQFGLICDLIGKPNKTIWKEFYQMENAENLLIKSSNQYNNLNKIFGKFGDKCVNFLNGFLAWDPNKRITASEAMRHEFFMEYPYTTKTTKIPYQKFI